MKSILIIAIIYLSISFLLFLLQVVAREIMGNESDQFNKMKFSKIIKYSLQWPYIILIKILPRA